MTPAQTELQAALALHQDGNLAAAEAAYREWLQRHGSHPDAEHLLALALHAQGRSKESLPLFKRAERERGGAKLWNNHAAALLSAGRSADAADRARRAVQADPRAAGAWLNLGFASEIEGSPREAVDAFEHVLRLAPDNAPARRALARCQLLLKDAAATLSTLDPIPPGSDTAADLIRAEALIDRRRFDAASALLQFMGDDAAAGILGAKIAVGLGHSDDALAALQRITESNPDNRQAVTQAALLWIARGDADLGLALFQNWLTRHPDDTATAANYLVACNYSDRFDPPAMLAEHRKFAPAPTPIAPWPQGYRKRHTGVRVGWLASAFTVGPIEIFFADVLQAFPRIAPDVEHVLFATGGEITSSSRKNWGADHRDLRGKSDMQVADAIRAEGVDVLIDMVGRAAGNRVRVLASRVAPVQIGWLDAFYSSGIETIDYLFTDPWLSPPGAEVNFSEQLLRLPHGRLAYSPPPAEPSSVDAAETKRFVSLNRFSKIGDDVVAVWSAILRALPDWSLLLKAHGRDDDLTAHFHRRFAQHGIDAARVDIEGGGSYSEAMETYSRGSIALDPFPFSGCSTTCDALWMGLPVITLPRQTMASRQSAAWLEMSGQAQWIAHDAEAYVSTAIAVANDPALRREWRRVARSVLRPTIGDSERCAREIIDAVRRVANPSR